MPHPVPTPKSDDPAEKTSVPEVHGDRQAEQEAERAKEALGNVNEGYEKAPPWAGGEPTWPTGGNISQGPRRKG